LSDRAVTGASVGDSEAWIINESGVHDLTAGQQRKPLIGSGRATPMPFAADAVGGTLVIATDGLFKYVPAARIVEIARALDLDQIPGRLVEAARLRSGALQDDVAIVACRRWPG
jgi:PPM family protein phosphatase